MIRLVVWGAGGHGRVVAESALRSGRFEIVAFLDDDSSRSAGRILGVPVVGGLEKLDEVQGPCEVALGVGENRARAAGLSSLRSRGVSPSVVVDGTAVVANSATLGNGTFVSALGVVQTRAVLGEGCIVNTAAIVEHDARIGSCAHVSCGAILGGGVLVGDLALVGIGARVLPGVRIGVGATVGAGSVVLRDVADGVTVVGVPARRVGGAEGPA